MFCFYYPLTAVKIIFPVFIEPFVFHFESKTVEIKIRIHKAIVNEVVKTNRYNIC
jgi:hypothetical protein